MAMPHYTHIHIDVEPGEGIDLALDLNKTPWPWGDDSVEIIVAEDLVEHLAINLLPLRNLPVPFNDETHLTVRSRGLS